MVHDFILSTWDSEIGRSLSSRLSWSTELVPGKSRLYRETTSKNRIHKEGNKKENIVKLSFVMGDYIYQL